MVVVSFCFATDYADFLKAIKNFDLNYFYTDFH